MIEIGESVHLSCDFWKCHRDCLSATIVTFLAGLDLQCELSGIFRLFFCTCSRTCEVIKVSGKCLFPESWLGCSDQSGVKAAAASDGT